MTAAERVALQQGLRLGALRLAVLGGLPALLVLAGGGSRGLAAAVAHVGLGALAATVVECVGAARVREGRTRPVRVAMAIALAVLVTGALGWFQARYAMAALVGGPGAGLDAVAADVRALDAPRVAGGVLVLGLWALPFVVAAGPRSMFKHEGRFTWGQRPLDEEEGRALDVAYSRVVLWTAAAWGGVTALAAGAALPGRGWLLSVIVVFVTTPPMCFMLAIGGAAVLMIVYALIDALDAVAALGLSDLRERLLGTRGA